MAVPVQRNDVVIRSLGKKGWEILWDGGRLGERVRVPTAAEALARVRARDVAFAESGLSMVTTITWETKTTLEFQIVKALQS